MAPRNQRLSLLEALAQAVFKERALTGLMNVHV